MRTLPGVPARSHCRSYDSEARFTFTGALHPLGTRVLLGRCSLAQSFVWTGCKPVTAVMSPLKSRHHAERMHSFIQQTRVNAGLRPHGVEVSL